MKQSTTESHLTDDGRFKCRFDGCDKSFKVDGAARITYERVKHDFIYKKVECNTLSFGSNLNDDCLNYQIAFLEYGMILRNFHDAISEADGPKTFSSDNGKFSCYIFERTNHQVKSILWKVYMYCFSNMPCSLHGFGIEALNPNPTRPLS